MTIVSVEVEDHHLLHPLVLKGIVDYNARFVGSHHALKIGVAARDEDNVLVGGAVGSLWVDCLFLDLLWVSEERRGQGVGARLLRTFEDEGRSKGASAILLDTFDFQAAPFYEKQGYIEEARLVAMVDGRDRIYMTKRGL